MHSMRIYFVGYIRECFLLLDPDYSTLENVHIFHPIKGTFNFARFVFCTY